jgi:hypothetical protein
MLKEVAIWFGGWFVRIPTCCWLVEVRVGVIIGAVVEVGGDGVFVFGIGVLSGVYWEIVGAVETAEQAVRKINKTSKSDFFITLCYQFFVGYFGIASAPYLLSATFPRD